MPVPYSIFANTASNVSGTLPATQLSGTVPVAQLPSVIITNGEAGVNLGANLSAGSLTVSNNLNLPATTATSGIIYSGVHTLLHDFGTRNFFGGPDAGNLTLSGSDNTGIGYAALLKDQSGNNNTANGYQALINNTNGNFNIALGYLAGQNLATGDNNILIGNQGIDGNNNTIRIGTQGSHTNTFIAGIYGAPTSGGSLVYVNAAGQLGTTSAQLPAAVVTNTETGVTLSGTFIGNGAGLTNLNVRQLPGTVLTNHESGVTLSGAFSGDGGGLTNLNVAQLTALPNLQQIALLKWGVWSNSFNVGSGPIDICFDGANVWVANFLGNSVTKLNTSTGSTIGTYSAGSQPYRICFDGSSIWVVNNIGYVTKLNANTGANIGTYDAGNGPWGICFDGANIWVTDQGNNTVTKLNASTGATIGTYNVGSSPAGICFDGTSIWVGKYSGSVTKF